MKKKTSKSIFIIGNGFDLNCGLSTKFSHFFETKLKDIKAAADNYYPNTTRTCNLWYLLLYYAFYDENYYESEYCQFVERIEKDDILWMDVEGFIKKILCCSKNTDGWIKKYLKQNNYLSELTILHEERNKNRITSNDDQRYAIKKHFRLLSDTNLFSVVDHLYNELVEFEKDFKEYVQKCQYDSKTYDERSYKIIEEFYTGERMISIIDFNYTFIQIPYIQKSKFVDRDVEINKYNIHGEYLCEQVVIGFDASDISDSELNVIQMSKAWQKMNSNFEPYQLPRKDEVEWIKFYGHSLGEQDYSYFHAIFDYYDIYRSDVRLMFFYTEYEKTDEKNKAIRENFISKVYSLLNNYALQSGNEEHVRTIVSKLQLENRLIIRKISNYNTLED